MYKNVCDLSSFNQPVHFFYIHKTTVIQGMIALILETIDRCSQWRSMRQLAHMIGEDCANKWNDMISYLYLLLGTN